MKTSWTVKTVNTKPPEWRAETRRRFEARTGLHWQDWHAHGKVHFAPTWMSLDPAPRLEKSRDEVLAAIRRLPLREGLTFLQIAEAAGLPLLDAALACYHLACVDHDVLPLIARTGRAVGIYRRHP